ncbi:Ephrin type-A receptor 4-A [Holothuria leucospilota]|uniref:Ephrin type-A receptor 4-A n=1 Tax=Holothuria leucospilota TaxID=206669 RepID=A0A9Q1BXP6_HOLLE|nr:Ephrin type-A receptor 4-A [Holothuria leucospilota]
MAQLSLRLGRVEPFCSNAFFITNVTLWLGTGDPQTLESVAPYILINVVKKCSHPGLQCKKVLLNVFQVCKLYDFCPSTAAVKVIEFYAEKGEVKSVTTFAPENIFLREHSPASDIWSLGLTLWEIYSGGEDPFKLVKKEDFERLLKTRVVLRQPVDCPESIFSVMKRCWSKKCQDRPNLYQIKSTFEGTYMTSEDPFKLVKKEDFERLLKTRVVLRQPVDCPESIFSVMKRCWSKKCQDRPNLYQIKSTFEGTYMTSEDPFKLVKKEDFERLLKTRVVLRQPVDCPESIYEAVLVEEMPGPPKPFPDKIYF